MGEIKHTPGPWEYVVRKHGQFLLDRLDEFERDGLGKYGRGEREWIGHVAPAISRFRAAIAKALGDHP